MDEIPPPSWSGPHGDRLDLLIEGYQLPDASDGYDANWLTLRINARNSEGQWAASSSCILTWELQWISRWLTYVVDGEMADERFDVTEFDFGMVFVDSTDSGYRFAACLKHGLSRGKDSDGSSVVNVEMSLGQLHDAVGYFRWASQAFPARGKAGERGLALPGPQRLGAGRERHIT